MRVKVCKKCNIEKSLEEFVLNKQCKDGREGTCKCCSNARQKELHFKNPHARKIISHRYYENNKDEVKAANRHWRKNNTQRMKDLSSKWFELNREKMREWRRNWYWNNLEKSRAKLKRQNAKRRGTAIGKLNHAISVEINVSLRKGKEGQHWESIVGFTSGQLKEHIEKQFVEGMTWNNYGKIGWELDHIIPISAFNFKTAEDIDFKKCWSLENLRPLWKHDNRIKSNKLNYPFQPSLAGVS